MHNIKKDINQHVSISIEKKYNDFDFIFDKYSPLIYGILINSGIPIAC